jgi:hypothetical protein
MKWFWLAGVAIVGIVAGYFAGWWAVVSAMRPSVQQLNRNLANDRNLALSVLRRELANWMFRYNADRYVRSYKKAHEAAKAIKAADRSDQRTQLAKLTEKYKFYMDFDLLSTREYVLYADALSGNTYDEIERHYTDIIEFQALQIAVDDNWSDIHPPTNDAELAHLEKYVLRFKDLQFKNRLKDAIREFRICQANGAREPFYETAVFRVRPVSHFAETRYGVHFKDTDEFGLYTVFNDDGRDKTYISFYRSDATFEKETMLDELLIDESYGPTPPHPTDGFC